MDDDKIKDIFKDFKPGLSSDADFFLRLERNLDSVEAIRRRSSELQSRSRKALGIAAAAGFLSGLLFSSLLPRLEQALTAVQAPAGSMLNILADNYMPLAWLFIGGSVLLTSLNAYYASLSLLRRRQEPL